ncbi:heavy-metal-associated domain-containing protein [Bartonella sp. HY329]|uniref:heavy-metal-associated domain-containing protein n=1 Tax=unclassified Bartonella TaxID=2645622 RepID=UPI0021C84711|nr:MULTISPECIES: heavy-metal-associated domain-containing protein [unclassified Bartonella]UXM95594.1 heavy-metal-associated domain-containing protein [Bartonella sp. HY329]UXN09919.1 heavy-metal-associated domain-containing protein [Bartonella sp. HY328]
MSTNEKIVFRVADMTCGHCVKSVTSAIIEAIPNATVNADVATHLVTVMGTQDADKVKQAIIDADYTPEAA